MRKLKDGWPIYEEWVAKNKDGKRRHFVQTDCIGCFYHRVTMLLTALVANGPDHCVGCLTYREHNI